MKKLVIIALAMLFAGATAVAQPKKPKTPPTPQAKVITLTGDKQDAATPESKGVKAMEGEIIELPPVEIGMDVPLRHVLDKRRTVRQFNDEEIPMEFISSLLWTAYGFNRPDEQKRVVPSAVNAQEFDIYLFTHDGVFLYSAEKNTLGMVTEGDHRTEISTQRHFVEAPVAIVMVANYDRMTMFKETDTRDFYAAVDAGYISQNIYLFCAANDLGTVACGGIDREAIQKIIGFKNGRAILAHPVGRPR